MNAHQVNCRHEHLTFTGEIPCTGPRICEKCKLPEAKIHDEFGEVLELAVDRYGVKYVLEALSTVCELKALHIKENWDDVALAKRWYAVSHRIDAALNTHAVKELTR